MPGRSRSTNWHCACRLFSHRVSLPCGKVRRMQRHEKKRDRQTKNNQNNRIREKPPCNASPLMTNAIRKYTHVSFKKHEPNTETSSNILSEFIGLSLKSIASHLFTRPIVLHSCRARRAHLYWNYQPAKQICAS